MKDVFFYIVVPFYNVQDYLAQCLESIAAQSYKHFHCVLVNDGSTDESLKVARDFLAKFEHKKTRGFPSAFSIINKENGGPGFARNAGFDKACELAKADDDDRLNFIWFVDSDDWILPNSLKIIKDAILKHPNIDYFQSNCVKLYNEQTKKSTCEKEVFLPAEFENKASNPVDVISALGVKYMRFFNGWSYCFNIDFLSKNNMRHIENIIFEDVTFVLECRLKAKLAYVSSEHIYVYRVNRAGSIMNNVSKYGKTESYIKKANAQYIIMLEIERIFSHHTFPKNIQKLLCQYLTKECIKLLRILQVIGYRDGLCFEKKDLSRFYNNLSAKYKICYHIPRIYGFPKNIKLFFEHIFSRFFGR